MHNKFSLLAFLPLCCSLSISWQKIRNIFLALIKFIAAFSLERGADVGEKCEVSNPGRVGTLIYSKTY